MKKDISKKYEKHSREELISELEELKKKRYGLVWDRKHSQENLDVFVNWENVPESFNLKQFPVLEEVKGKEIKTNKEKPVNLLIEGDNYHSLAVLNFTHHELIDVIYIDPPYNTGNKDFIYNDSFVDREDPWRHSKWLSFMEKRLKVAKNLLKKGGVIFISIDDNEYAQLKLLCDEIFDENNFITTITVQVNKGGRDYLPIAVTHEYILCYFKSEEGELNELPKAVDFDLEDLRGKYELRELRNRNPRFTKENRPNLYYPIYVNPNSKDDNDQCLISLNVSKTFSVEVYPLNSKGEGSCWRWSQNLVKENITDKIVSSNVVGKQRRDGGWNIYEKSRKATTKVKSIWDETDVRTEQGTIDLRELGMAKSFDHPKPIFLIKKIVRIATKENSIVLDFMAGSGTTGHAVLELNKEDSGNRKFILCTNNENNICTDVCYPRLQKVITGYTNQKSEKIDGLGGNLKYLKTDFVAAQPTDKNRRDLVNKSADMICVREDIFDLVSEDSLNFKIFQKNNKYLGIVFNENAISGFTKAANKLDGDFIVYCFSYGEAAPEKEFEANMKNKYTIKPIPEIILRVYREIFKQ